MRIWTVFSCSSQCQSSSLGLRLV